MSITAADGLDDGLDYAYDVSDGEDSGVVIEGESDKKRKHEESEVDDDGDDLVKLAMKTEDSSSSGKKKKPKNEKFAEKKRLKMEYDVEQKKQLSKQTPDIISERLAQKLHQQYPDLSPLELSEKYISKSFIKYTGDWDSERTLVNFEKFLQEFCGEYLPSEEPLTRNQKRKNKQAKKHNRKRPQDDSRKFVLTLSMSALRACDIHRASRAVPGSSMKLINKNKIQDDLKYLETTRCRILAGTAGRVERILKEENSPLKASEIAVIICDSSYLDSKKQNLWDLKENIQFISEITKANPNTKVLLY